MTTPDVQQRGATRDSTAQEAQASQTPQTSPLVPTAPLIRRESTTQPTPPISQPLVALPATTQTSWNWFLRILGGVLAIGAGIGNIYLVTTMWWGESQISWWPMVGLVGCGVLAVVAAALLRSWWAVLIVPVAVWVGAQLGLLLRYGFSQDGSSALATYSFFVLLVAVLPAIIGAVIGVPIGKLIAQSIRHYSGVNLN